MSARSEFYDEVYNLPKNKGLSLDDKRYLIRDKWIQEKKYRKLISYILDDYSSRNCVEFMTLLTEQLVKENKLKLYKRIWTPVIKYNAENFWIYEIHNLIIDFPNITWSELEAIDTSHIKPYGSQSDNSKENASFWGKYYLKALQLCKSGLERMEDRKEVDNFSSEIQNIYNLEQKPFKENDLKTIRVIDKRKINEVVFWELIDICRKKTENTDEFIEILREKLLAFKITEIKAFQKLLLTYHNQLNHWNIWALAYVNRRGCGDDCFEYFRFWIISKGKEAFEIIKDFDINNFNKVFNDEDPQFEEFEYLAEEVYSEKTGKVMKQPSVKVSKIQGREWDEDKICLEFPKLCKIFNFKMP
jgi:hypothetical protein